MANLKKFIAETPPGSVADVLKGEHRPAERAPATVTRPARWYAIIDGQRMMVEMPPEVIRKMYKGEHYSRGDLTLLDRAGKPVGQTVKQFLAGRHKGVRELGEAILRVDIGPDEAVLEERFRVMEEQRKWGEFGPINLSAQMTRRPWAEEQ